MQVGPEMSKERESPVNLQSRQLSFQLVYVHYEKMVVFQLANRQQPNAPVCREIHPRG